MDADAIYREAERMTRSVPREPELTPDAVWAQVHALLDTGPIPGRVGHVSAWTADAARMTRRQEAGLPLGKHRDPDGVDRAPVPTLEAHVSTWPAPTPGRRARVRKPRRVARPRWCRQCGRITATCTAVGECTP